MGVGVKINFCLASSLEEDDARSQLLLHRPETETMLDKKVPLGRDETNTNEGEAWALGSK